MNSEMICKIQRESKENILNLQILKHALEKILACRITIKYS